jgi:glycosyltransferase involved in cell wall biosynthesis
MKIAVWHNLPSGGGKRALYHHISGLVARGHSVHVWTPPTADRDFWPTADLAAETIVPLSDVPPPRTMWLGAHRYTRARLREMDRHCRAVADLVNAGGFDLLLSHPCQFFRPVAIARYVRIPSVLYLHEPYRPLYEARRRAVLRDGAFGPLPHQVWMAPPPLRVTGRLNYISYLMRIEDASETRARRLQVREEVENAEAFSRILVNSHFSRESVLRAYGLDARVCYLGIDTKLFVNRNNAREPFVVGTGSLSEEKNIDFVVRALGTLATPPKLVWVGNLADPPYLNHVRAVAEQLRVPFEPRVAISDQELIDILNRASLMVYAPRLEPFGYAPLEANACGVPVVAVAEGGVRETVIDGVNGLIVDPDPFAAGMAIRQLIDNPAFATILGDRSRQLVVERWSLSAALERFEGHLIAVAEPVRRGAGV